MSVEESATRLSLLFSAIYFHCHSQFDMDLSHQAVRLMQYLAVVGPSTVSTLAAHSHIAQNTASETIQRLQRKNLVEKHRRPDDERVVNVSLTETGHAAVLQHTGLDTMHLAEPLKQLSREERDNILNAFSKLLAIVGG